MSLNLIDLLNNFQYHIIGIVNRRIVPILIDTGASWSHISKEFCDDVKILPEPHIVEKFDGSERILTAYSTVSLQLSGIEKLQLDILVDEEPNKFLLGIDFLENFNYSITSDYLTLDESKQIRYKLNEETIRAFLN